MMDLYRVGRAIGAKLDWLLRIPVFWSLLLTNAVVPVVFAIMLWLFGVPMWIALLTAAGSNAAFWTFLAKFDRPTP